ncbi:hypothetical protein GCM10011583_13970 [Streptomyces camponoticapitis]|uniref:Uncharacterized protein n=1 Tax=Streptomyces camponoticapitis TaxID=1616125 RepID=A0ABQ2E113_9ACTN|nr:hypothetical protein GCM10011583_13970 [Streptomyces camponoticapitis]
MCPARARERAASAPKPEPAPVITMVFAVSFIRELLDRSEDLVRTNGFGQIGVGRIGVGRIGAVPDTGGVR